MESAEPKEPAAFPRHVPAPAAAERLWQAYAQIDPGRETAGSWDAAIAPLTRALSVEESARLMLFWAGLVLVAVAIASFASRPGAAALLAALAGAAGLAWYSFGRARATHPLGKWLRRWHPMAPLDERVEAVLHAFATAVPLFPSEDSETAATDRPIGPETVWREMAAALFHSQFPHRRAAAQRLGDEKLANMVVRESDLTKVLDRVRPIATYVDLIGANEWEFERAERATLATSSHRRHTEIRAYFAVLRWQGERDLQGFTLQQNEQAVIDFIKARRLPADLSRTRYSQFRNGSHAFKDWFRPR
jgi:hypothetical protein